MSALSIRARLTTIGRRPLTARIANPTPEPARSTR